MRGEDCWNSTDAKGKDGLRSASSSMPEAKAESMDQRRLLWILMTAKKIGQEGTWFRILRRTGTLLRGLHHAMPGRECQPTVLLCIDISRSYRTEYLQLRCFLSCAVFSTSWTVIDFNQQPPSPPKSAQLVYGLCPKSTYLAHYLNVRFWQLLFLLFWKESNSVPTCVSVWTVWMG